MGSLTHLDEPCVSCHVAVPHGSRRSRLIGYGSSEIGPADVPPYNYSGNSLKVSGFKKASGPNNYAESNCYSTNGACSAKHTDAGGYDP